MVNQRAILIAVVGGLATSMGTVAQSKDLNMATITCDELAGMSEATIGAIAAWISGYFNAKANNTIIDLDTMLYNASVVDEACQKNPTVPVMQIITERLPQ
jgi:hypothetical protein